MSPTKGTRTQSTPVDTSKFMTLADVATYLHCHYSTAVRMLHHGGLPGFKLGAEGDWRFLRSEIDKWIARRHVAPVEEATAKPAGRGRYKRKPRTRS